MAKNAQPASVSSPDESSYFDGGFWGLLGCSLLTGLVTAITFGIAFPWMYCFKQRWIARHTVVCGKRMYFNGTGVQLIGKYLLWMLLSILTLGIYSFWMRIALKKWITFHTHYEGEPDNNSFFDGRIGGFIGINILCTLIPLLTLGIGTAWANKLRIEWEAKHTVIDSRRHVFVGTGGALFLKYLLYGFLTFITLGIFALWIPIKLIKWQTAHTIDNEHTTPALIKQGEYRAAVQAQAAHLHAQRVEDEMAVVKSGINDSTSQEALLQMAEAGNAAAQYTYTLRYSGGDYAQPPYDEFLRAAAMQGYAPAMCTYGLSGLCQGDAQAMLSGAAKAGQIPAMLHCMRNASQAGLTQADDDLAMPHLKDSVRWCDTLLAGENPVTEEDTATYHQCQMRIRRIRTKTPPYKLTALKIIGIVLLVLLCIGMLGLAVSGITALLGMVSQVPIGGSGSLDRLFPESQSSPALIPGQYEASPEAFQDSLMWMDSYDESGHTPWADGSTGYGEAAGNGAASARMDRLTFMDTLRYTLEGEPHYYDVQVIASGVDAEVYSLSCSHWYWVSYFELTAEFDDQGLYRILLEGPRIYETIDENINALEFQSLTRALYTLLGLGDGMDIYTDITPGTDHTENYPGWSFCHSHTEDTLTLEITAQS